VPAREPPGDDGDARLAGFALLGIAGLSAVVTLTFATDSQSTDGGSNAALAVVFGGLTVISGVAGGALLVNHTSAIQVAPMVTVRSVGVAISGRL
jgi:hypothetical protein